MTEAGGILPPGSGDAVSFATVDPGAVVAEAGLVVITAPESAPAGGAVVALVESEVAFLVSGLDPHAVHTRKSMAQDAVTKFFVIVYVCSIFYECMNCTMYIL